MLLLGWTAIRLASVEQQGEAPPAPVAIAAKQLPLTQIAEVPPEPVQIADRAQPIQLSTGMILSRKIEARRSAKPPVQQTQRPAALHDAVPAAPALPAAKWVDAVARPSTMLARAEPQLMPAVDPVTAAEKSFSLYAYNFWRWPMSAPALATAGQYGGSQSGLIANVRLWSAARLDARFRLAAAPYANGEREVALGFNWHPLSAVPLSLIAERRLRANAPDAFAFGLAGGTPPLALPLGFTLESYGQAGWVTGAAGGYYFDASAQATKNLLDKGGVQLAFGGGAWAGGQTGVARLDAGPRLDLRASPAGIPLRLSADWRFRLAGDALPANGPALTVSTGF